MDKKVQQGRLYLVPTPIGNLQEITPRILEILSSCAYIYCEDTRNTKKLLDLLNIKNQNLISCHKFNEKEKSLDIINKINSGNNVAYVSDAGYPCISDPGEIIVKEIIKEGIKVVPLSGPTASLTSLIASSLSKSHFIFYGFLKSKASERRKEIEELKNYRYTIIFYESPYRVQETIDDFYEILGNREITIAREISKLHEEFIYTSLEKEYKKNKEYKGEIVLILEGNTELNSDIDKNEIKIFFDKLIKSNLTKKDSIEALSVFYKITKSKIKELLDLN